MPIRVGGKIAVAIRDSRLRDAHAQCRRRAYCDGRWRRRQLPASYPAASTDWTCRAGTATAPAQRHANTVAWPVANIGTKSAFGCSLHQAEPPAERRLVLALPQFRFAPIRHATTTPSAQRTTPCRITRAGVIRTPNAAITNGASDAGTERGSAETPNGHVRPAARAGPAMAATPSTSRHRSRDVIQAEAASASRKRLLPSRTPKKMSGVISSTPRHPV
jgi:hypothetical protein